MWKGQRRWRGALINPEIWGVWGGNAATVLAWEMSSPLELNCCDSLIPAVTDTRQESKIGMAWDYVFLAAWVSLRNG